MVIPHTIRKDRGWLMIELLAAIALLVAALLPLAYSFTKEKKLARSQFQRAVAMELVDGEFEVLASGEWRTYGLGNHAYKVKAAATTNLPPGQFTLSVTRERLKLEWKPSVKTHGGSVVREAKFR
jgi:type II secretory pathway pseudopilin PulG